MKYNWREQEKLSQLWRIKIAKASRWGTFGSTMYLVFAYNEATHEIKPFDTSGQGNHRRYGTKAEAIKGAQWWAQREHLPFIARRDYDDYVTLKDGPVLECVVCGREWRVRTELARGWDRDACPACKAKVVAYDNEHADVKTYKVGKNGVINHPGAWYSYKDSHKRLLGLLLQIAAPVSQIKGGSAYNLDGVVIGGRSTGFRYGVWEFPTQEWRLDALRKAIGAINTTIQTAYDEGVKEGSSLLRKLAKGEIHPQDFSDQRVRKGDSE